MPSSILVRWHLGHVTQIQLKVLSGTYTQNVSQMPQSLAKLTMFFQYPKRRPPPFCLCKNDFGHTFYHRCHYVPAYNIWWECAHPCMSWKWHFDQIINGGRRHLEFWLDGMLSDAIQFCTYILNWRQISQFWAKLWLFFQNPRWRPNQNITLMCKL